jgi:hypothetical protein
MSKLDLAASDISKLGTAAGAPAATSGAAAGTGAAVGAGPGGVTLYNAEWVVEPSDAQLRTFLSRTVEAGSWALIACQTITHNQVENCAQLGESPRGSGLSKAMRLAPGSSASAPRASMASQWSAPGSGSASISVKRKANRSGWKSSSCLVVSAGEPSALDLSPRVVRANPYMEE